MSRLTTNDLRSRATAFVANHKGDSDEMKHTQTFWNDFFFDIFGLKRERVAVYERSVEKLKGPNKGRIDLFWPGEIIIEQKSLGKDLLGAEIQAMDYTHGLSDAEMPKRILVCDFQQWKLIDLTTNETTTFLLDDLPKKIDLFNWVLGRQTAKFKDQDPVNIKAAELVGHLHDLLKASGYAGHKLEVFLTRTVFCLFADDTGIFEPKDILWDYLEHRTAADGSDLGPKLAQLFDVLNTPEHQRQTTLDPDLARFPYVNGHLFAEYFPPPSFDTHMRVALLNACRFDWTPISPAIFGSLFQSVMDADERRKKGAHYTTEKNIQKLIGPLFMDDLRAEFGRAKARKTGREAALRAFHDRLAGLTFFDPACGCGNFLIIAYRELRALELELLLELRTSTQLTLDAASLSRIDVDQFYGIEIAEFPARIAETALWMMDHLMNLALSAAFGGYYPRIPLKKSPKIVHGDALEMDWAEVLPPERCSYVLGNPPFIGKTYQTAQQRSAMEPIVGKIRNGKLLDFVCAWFLKSAAYVKGTSTPVAFVSTNSIVQREQASILWREILGEGQCNINFAHRTFQWMSEARGRAAVHCVIVGFSQIDRVDKRLFEYSNVNSEPVEQKVSRINSYLLDAALVVVEKAENPITPRKLMRYGSKPADGGHLILDSNESENFKQIEPNAAKYLRPYIGSEHLINGGGRECLWLQGANPSDLVKLPKLRERLAKVREFREVSTDASTRKWADSPALFQTNRQPNSAYLALPEVSSERRQYVPIAWLSKEIIASNLLYTVEGANLSDFALLTSAMHMAWLRHIGGRLKSDYRYSIGLVYNTFPLPPSAQGGGNPALQRLEPLAQAVLDARAAHPGATLATLYDPDLMPENLRRAHQALDRAVDRLYRPAGFASDRERVEHLFALYEGMVAPLLHKAAKKPRRKGG